MKKPVYRVTYCADIHTSTTAALCLSAPLLCGLAALTGGNRSPWLGLLYLPLAFSGLLTVTTAVFTAVWVSANYVLFSTLVFAAPGPRAAETAVQVAVYFIVALGVAWLARRDTPRPRDSQTNSQATKAALDVEHMITAAYDLEMTLDLVVLKQREMLAADSYGVLLVEGTSLRVRAGGGLGPDAMSARYSMQTDEHGWTPSGGQPLLVADTHLTSTGFTVLDPAARSLLLVPMQGVERVTGFLFYGGHEPDCFSTLDVDQAVTFADNIVFAVQRAMLEEELKRLAYTDAQTSLFNHRHFQVQLDEEVRRAQRYGRPVSLILLDIDSFKEFNDTNGHPAGDRVLAEMAAILKAELRMVDIAARYGGEEFVIICPETHGEQAMILAERLCLKIGSTTFVTDGPAKHRITVSLGVAAYPSDAAGKSDLVDAADKALYEAKRTGKNRAVRFQRIQS